MKAFEIAPATSGEMDVATSAPSTPRGDDAEESDADVVPTDTHSFEWVADADTRLGPVLEAIVNGRYFWVPFHRIREVTIATPCDVRDAVWMPATFRWSNGGEAVGFIPTRYPGTESRTEDDLRLARRTEFSEPAENLLVGVGQRLLATDEDEFPLMNVRSLRLETSESPSDADGDANSSAANDDA